VTAQRQLQERIFIPYAPDIPGLVFRGYQGEFDFQVILDLINASKGPDQLDRSDSLEDVTRYYTHLNNCDLDQDLLFAEIDGKPIAYCRGEWNIDWEGNWVGFTIGYSDPDFRRKGIGSTILRYFEDHLCQIADQHLAEGVIAERTPRYFEGFFADTEVGKETLFKNAGYSPVRFSYTMVRPLSEPVEITTMPEGLELRKVQPEQYRQLWEADQEAFRDHWGYIEGTEQDYQRWLKDPLNDPDLWRVAWDCDQVAGMVLNFLNEKENEEYNRLRGWTENISVRKAWRRRGLARALLTRSLQMFKDMGMDHAALGVDTQNPNGALNLYESVGFQVEKSYTVYWKEF
jgi:ribosomal protein S18 acetylase RimI-like enzyme